MRREEKERDRRHNKGIELEFRVVKGKGRNRHKIEGEKVERFDVGIKERVGKI